jgi:creatinine amidohydrolase
MKRKGERMPVEQLDHMTWEEVGAAVDRGAGIAIAITSTEQHGPHLPLGTDAMLGQALVLAAAEGLDVVVAPPMVYGYRSRPLSGGGQRFPGTTSLRATTLIALVTDVLGEFIRHGFRNIALVSHHMENANLIYEAAYEVVGPDPGGDVKVMVIENPYPAAFSDAVQQAIYPDGPPPAEPPGLGLDHASVQETSLMMHLRPELVRADRIVDDLPERVPGYDLLPIPDGFTVASGCLSGATQASAEKGAGAWPEAVAHLHGLLARELVA